MQTSALFLSFFFATLLVIGGLASLYLAWRLVRIKTDAANSTGSMSGRIGKWTFKLGAGSAATMAIAVSVLWAAAGIWARPKIEFSSESKVPGGGVMKFISQVEVKQPTGPWDPNQLENYTAVASADAASADAAADAAAAAADSAQTSADEAAQAADAAADAAATDTAQNGSNDGG